MQIRVAKGNQGATIGVGAAIRFGRWAADLFTSRLAVEEGDGAMKSVSDYVRGFSKGLIFKAVFVFVAITTVAVALLYMESLGLPLPESYGQAIANISLYKLQIMKKGFYIYAIYAAFVLAGVIVISWLYSYSVARPFRGIEKYAKALAKGNFDTNFEYDWNSDVHPLVVAIGRMARDCKSRNENLHKRIEVLAREVGTLEAALESGNREEFDRLYHSISAQAEDIEEVLSGVKL
jgi:methyl-accepting chemotaxis protein